MDCSSLRSQLFALSADDVSPQTAQMLRQHLDACPECQQEWQFAQHTMMMLSTTVQPLPDGAQSRAMWRHCSNAIYDNIETRRMAQQQPFWSQWMITQPRWGWATLGAAIAVLGSVWMMTPQDSSPNDAPATIAAISQPNSPGHLVTFRPLPREAGLIVNHHAAMSMDPFTDHVGSTLVSASAP